MIQRTVLPGKEGLTLVEVMIALLVFLLVSLAMMQTALMSIEANTSNLLRDEAVSVADMRMTQARSIASTNDPAKGFDSLVADPVVPVQVTRPVRNFAAPGVTFNTTRTVANIDGDTKQVTIAVTWQWKGENHNHTITSIMRRPS